MKQRKPTPQQLRKQEEMLQATQTTFDEIVIRIAKIKLEINKINKEWDKQDSIFRNQIQSHERVLAKYNRLLRYKKETLLSDAKCH